MLFNIKVAVVKVVVLIKVSSEADNLSLGLDDTNASLETC